MKRAMTALSIGLLVGLLTYAAGWWVFIDTLSYVEQAEEGFAHFFARMFALAGGAMAAGASWTSNR